MAFSPVEVLKKVPLFSGLSETDLQAFADLARERGYPKGSVIVFEDDPGDAMYLVAAGQVKVVLIAEDGVKGHEGSSELGGKLLARAMTHYSTRGAGGLAVASRRRICCTMSVRMSRKSSCSSCSFARISASL